MSSMDPAGAGGGGTDTSVGPVASALGIFLMGGAAVMSGFTTAGLVGAADMTSNVLAIPAIVITAALVFLTVYFVSQVV